MSVSYFFSAEAAKESREKGNLLGFEVGIDEEGSEVYFTDKVERCMAQAYSAQNSEAKEVPVLGKVTVIKDVDGISSNGDQGAELDATDLYDDVIDEEGVLVDAYGFTPEELEP